MGGRLAFWLVSFEYLKNKEDPPHYHTFAQYIILMKLISYESVRYILLNVARFPLSSLAKLQGKRFSCQALSGESSYNIAVNSDFTVSCNCTDYYKTGQIGDLSTNSLAEIFDSPASNRLRTELSKGKLPLFQCVLCSDRRTVSKQEAASATTHYRLPHKVMMVENTIACNLRCISCPRESIISKRKSTYLSLQQIETLAKEFAQMKLRSLAYFNLGEPFVHDRIFDELTILKQYNPNMNIVLSTNGSLLETDKKRRAAMLLGGICVSIFGSDNATANKYQKGTDFDRAYQNLKDLIKHRDETGSQTQIEWKYVLFRWNDHPEQINRAIELARLSGVDKITFWPTLSPPWSFSWRWYTGKMKQIGEPFPHGRQVVFK